MPVPESCGPRAAVVLAVTFGSLLALGAVAVGVVVVAVARKVVTPPRRTTEDVRVLDVTEDTVTLTSTADTRLPGRYGLFLSRRTGYAQVGEIVRSGTDSVTRRLITVDRGILAPGVRAAISGWFYSTPADLGVDFTEAHVATPLGVAPAWIVPPAPGTETSGAGRWVIAVHGRGVRRQETLRAVPTFRNAGYTAMLVSYRNDGEAPSSADGRYGLGDTEWEDVDAAVRYAIDNGATGIVLMGWSMGGATVLQVLTRSASAGAIVGVVLESPVVDWVTALLYQGRGLGIANPFRRGVFAVLGHARAARLTGLAAPIDLARLDFVRRADELHVPVLLFHSDDDGFVPVTASRALAQARPDIVTFEEFAGARHTKLWNYDQERWTAAITAWLSRLPATSGHTGSSHHPPAAG